MNENKEKIKLKVKNFFRKIKKSINDKEEQLLLNIDK